MQTKIFWLFGGDDGNAVIPATDLPADVRGEELFTGTAEEAAALQTVPAKFRWEAAQREIWSPSAEFRQWMADSGFTPLPY